ncbi:MAG: 50S ribosomal protein L24e [Candidatus Kariarchaeaceae archaeon]|jgi:large subunit ribosomal protein L24e
MIREYECSFCGHDIARGTGMMYVKIDGSILRFCSRKCRISQVEHKRNPRKLKWTTKYERKF